MTKKELEKARQEVKERLRRLSDINYINKERNRFGFPPIGSDETFNPFKK